MINFNPNEQEKQTLTDTFRKEKHLGISWDTVNDGMNASDLVDFAKAVSMATEDTRQWVLVEIEDGEFGEFVLLEPLGHLGEGVLET